MSTSGKTAFAVASRLISLAVAAVYNSQLQLLSPALLLGIFSASRPVFVAASPLPYPHAPPSRREAESVEKMLFQ